MQNNSHQEIKNDRVAKEDNNCEESPRSSLKSNVTNQEDGANHVQMSSTGISLYQDLLVPSSDLVLFDLIDDGWSFGTWGYMPVQLKKKDENEARILRRCIHPNIIPLMGIYLDKNHVSYVISEKYAGSLYDIIHYQKQTLTMKTALHYIMNITKGLLFLKLRGYVHSKVNSASIMITTNEPNCLASAKLSDLTPCVDLPRKGTVSPKCYLPQSHYVNLENTNSKETERTDVYDETSENQSCISRETYLENHCAKKPFDFYYNCEYYHSLAPEQFCPDEDGRVHVCCKTDVYSLCVVLWEASFGKVPWEELSFNQLADAYIVNKSSLPPIPCAGTVDSIFQEAMELNRHDRLNLDQFYRKLEIYQNILTDENISYNSDMNFMSKGSYLCDGLFGTPEKWLHDATSCACEMHSPPLSISHFDLRTSNTSDVNDASFLTAVFTPSKIDDNDKENAHSDLTRKGKHKGDSLVEENHTVSEEILQTGNDKYLETGTNSTLTPKAGEALLCASMFHSPPRIASRRGPRTSTPCGNKDAITLNEPLTTPKINDNKEANACSKIEKSLAEINKNDSTDILQIRNDKYLNKVTKLSSKFSPKSYKPLDINVVRLSIEPQTLTCSGAGVDTSEYKFNVQSSSVPSTPIARKNQELKNNWLSGVKSRIRKSLQSSDIEPGGTCRLVQEATTCQPVGESVAQTDKSVAILIQFFEGLTSAVSVKPSATSETRSDGTETSHAKDQGAISEGPSTSQDPESQHEENVEERFPKEWLNPIEEDAPITNDEQKETSTEDFYIDDDLEASVIQYFEKTKRLPDHCSTCPKQDCCLRIIQREIGYSALYYYETFNQGDHVDGDTDSLIENLLKLLKKKKSRHKSPKESP